MHINPARVTRLQSVFAIIQMLLGLAVYEFPGEFRSPAYAPIYPYLPYVAAALMASGVALLQWRPFRQKWWFRIVSTLAAVPMAVLTVNTYLVGAWTGIAFYATVTVALAVAPWIADFSESERTGPDLFALVVATAFALIGGAMVLRPTVFQSAWFYAPLAEHVRALGLLGLLAAAALLWPRRATTPLASFVLRIVAAVFPAVWLYNWATTGIWSAVIFWGVLTAALLIGDVEFDDIRKFLIGRRADAGDWLQQIERTLEWWTWALAVLVVLLMAIVDEAAFAYPRVASWFVFAIVAYNVVFHRIYQGFGSTSLRIGLHLAFLVVSIGVLHIAGGPAGHGYLMLLVILPPLATSALGAVWGRRLLLFAVAAVVASELVIWLTSNREALLVGRIVVKVVMLVSAATVGMRSAEAFRSQRHELRKAVAAVKQLAEQDHLTNLPNRRYFQEQLDRAVAQCEQRGESGAIALFDLDGFKYVNDSLGHRAGDKLLVRVASMLRAQVEPPALLARLGGDEFALLLCGTDALAAEKMVGRVLQSIREYVTVLDGHPVKLTASAGIACFPDHGTKAEDLLAAADLAMYEAKARGRDLQTTFVPDAGWQEQAAKRRQWEGRIRRALADDQFVLECQPIWHVASASPHKFELLLRMVDTDGSLIPPAMFIPIAEDLGLIHGIDRWVVNRAIELVQAQARAGRDITVAVNLSGRAFSDPQLLSLIEESLDRTGVDPGALVLEVTETAAITDMSLAGRLIERLRQLGCRFALDDFGAGFSSLNLLKRLRFDYLKIDRSFIGSGAGNAIDREFVQAMVNIAHGLGQQVVAEGVEDEATLAWLAAIGVDYVQGYYLGRPRPVSSREWVEKQAIHSLRQLVSEAHL